MIAKNIVLFGKHPAWSDHMFVSDGTASSNYLKRVFYDHSVIPALQVGEGDKRISENWSFLVIIEDQPFFIVNAISRDSVGRRRFPLIAAYPLPHDIKLEAALEELRALKQELLSLLNKMLEPENDDLNQWQITVTQEAKSFKTNVDWSSINSTDVPCQLKQGEVLGLLTRLADDYDSLDLKSCPFTKACSFLKLGLKQFKSAPPAMLILDQEEQGTGLFFAMEGGTSFNLKHHLYDKRTSLSVSASNVPQKVSRLLKSQDPDELIEVDAVPSLKLGIHHRSGSRRFIILAIGFALMISVLFGLFNNCSSEDAASGDSYAVDSKQLSALDKWTLNASNYVEWIQPLIDCIAKQSEPIAGFESVAVVLESDLNPFAVVDAETVSMKLAKNPPEGFFDPEKNAKLSVVYKNIERLRTSLKNYYEKQFSDRLLKELKRQNYPQPAFIEVDFSQQPMEPDFGPGLCQQLERYAKHQAALDKVVTETKLLWNSIIKPLHQSSPEHAKFIQHCVQDAIETSESQDQFEEKYTALLQVFGYPKFIKLSDVDFDLLAENPAWTNLPEKEHDLESLREMVNLLKVGQKDEIQDKPAGLIQQGPIETSLLSDEQQIPLEKTLPSAELPSADEVLQSVTNRTEWDLFLEAGLKYFQDDRLISAIKGHAKAIQSRLFQEPGIESDEALSNYKEQVTDLITAFKRLDVSSLKKTSNFQSVYLENEERLQRLSDFMFAEYVSANVDSGDVESVVEVSQEISASVDNYLSALDQSFAELEAGYFRDPKDRALTNLSEKIAAVTENPLYVEGLFGSHFNILKAAISNDGIVPIETAEDLNWYLENLIRGDSIDLSQLTIITKAFNALESANQSSELSEMLRKAFQKGVQELSASDPQGLLKLYQNLSLYLPQNLQTSKDKEFQQIAEYWNRYNVDKESVTPTREAIVKLRDSTDSATVKNFYSILLSGYDSAGLQSADTFLEKIKESGSIKSVVVKDDRSRLDIEFPGRIEKLTFLPIETEKGTVFVQQAPLSLEQYIGLSNLCDFDTEYYLTLQDSLWPRSFEVGMGAGFSVLEQWQFRNRDIFSPIRAFNRKTLPAHLNEPSTVLRMANFFGFRLLRPDEYADFISLAARTTAGNIELSASDKESLENANTIQSSVYEQPIAELVAQGKWSGGVDFERGTPGENKFFDVVGGSAELAYDGVNFYALGGSWLYNPPVPETPVLISEPKRMYLDLGVRFAVDAPTLGFDKLVQNAALQVLQMANTSSPL